MDIKITKFGSVMVSFEKRGAPRIIIDGFEANIEDNSSAYAVKKAQSEIGIVAIEKAVDALMKCLPQKHRTRNCNMFLLGKRHGREELQSQLRELLNVEAPKDE